LPQKATIHIQNKAPGPQKQSLATPAISVPTSANDIDNA
jgi:hypothetical protein